MGTNRVKKITLLSIIFLVGIALVVGINNRAKAKPNNFNHLLNGDFKLMQTRGCISTNGDFGSNFEIIPPANGDPLTVTRQWLWDNGSFHFNGDGTGTIDSEEVNNFNFNTGTSGQVVGKTLVEGTFTYNVTSDRVVHSDIFATTKTLVGAGRCNTSTVTVRSTRHLVKGNSMLISAENGFESPGATGLDRTPSVETILQTAHPKNPDGSCDFNTEGAKTTLHRICGRGGLYIKVEGPEED
jgi:hypothetical protein